MPEKALALAPFHIMWYGTLARSYFIVGVQRVY